MAAPVTDIFALHAQGNPDKPAVIEGDDVRTFAELNGEVNRLANGLAGLGYGPAYFLLLPKARVLTAVFLGFFFFGAVMLAVGSIGNSQKYTQQLTAMFLLTSVVPFWTLPALLYTGTRRRSTMRG